jgi:hypothetical protein
VLKYRGPYEMGAKALQEKIKAKLENYFGQTVIVEWSISRGATDAFARSRHRYSPKVDVAVKTAGMSPGNHFHEIDTFWNTSAPDALKNKFDGLRKNRNPRCALAIEVVYSAAPKYILGDITNASMMGLYGVVVPSANMTPKVQQVVEYVNAVKAVGKAPTDLFQNLLIVPELEFLNLISG